jgi:hypothetical protein
MPNPPILFTRCRDASSLLYPVTGALTTVGTATKSYTETVKFGNGLKVASDGTPPSVTYAPSYLNNMVNVTFEFWFKSLDKYQEHGSGLLYISQDASRKFWLLLGGSTSLQCYYNGSSVISSDYVPSDNTVLHIGVVFLPAGISIYVNNSLWDDELAPASFSGNDITIVINGNNLTAGSGYSAIESFKIYDYAKTDFSDRFNERGGMNDNLVLG